MTKTQRTDAKATGQRAVGLPCRIPLSVVAYATVTDARGTLDAIPFPNMILILLRAKLTCGGNTVHAMFVVKEILHPKTKIPLSITHPNYTI